MSSSMPTLKAPTNEPLKDAESIHDYMTRDMAFDRTQSPTMMAYYNAFKYLVPFGDASSSNPEESLMETLQDHYMSRPHHHTTTELEEMTY